MVLSQINFDLFGLKRARSQQKYVNKGNHFGGSKAPRAPISVGEDKYELSHGRQAFLVS